MANQPLGREDSARSAMVEAMVLAGESKAILGVKMGR